MCQIQVPEEYEQPFVHINNTARRTFSGMVMAMDEAVRVLQNKYTITHQPDINIFNLSCKWWFAVLTSMHNLCNNQLQPFQDDKGVYGNGHGPGCITGIWCRASWAADPLQWEGSMNVGYPPKRRSSWHPRDFPLNKSEGNFKGHGINLQSLHFIFLHLLAPSSFSNSSDSKVKVKVKVKRPNMCYIS